MKKALIFDLDNTIYPVSSVAGYLFEKLFALLDDNSDSINTINDAKDELQRRHYHLVADKYNFGPELTEKGLNLLKDLEYDKPMQPFADYHSLKTVSLKKFLVTTGFTKLQWSKVRQLNIENDFDEIHIVDPEISRQTKKDVFADIMIRHSFAVQDLLVLGDDPESEIKAAQALGIETFLFDPGSRHPDAEVTYRSGDLKDVLKYIS